MKSLSLGQILEFHTKIIKATSGSDGVRDLGLIESALKKAEATFDGQELYEGSIKKISVITFALIKNHGFIDGNKQIGVATMLLLLRLNEISVKYEQEELVELGLKTAEGEFTEENIQKWIEEHQV
ncbi:MULTISPECIES: type II toxin-antitoxin system death-on-curing family toxin [Paenibacillus]|uniref:type II toxin-antitoxin system death-on-curing family toxin n=1 Tax=Paenibacillus TaxID=44249 RepID=UPI0020B7F462|nr:type II toxin-antitoxin system death-on-curing family toxin [Paenibacillus sp. CH40]MCP3795914.1 type II toxin-antitoxin system death-on-curing family toxin [Paenibacillus sp. CH40]